MRSSPFFVIQTWSATLRTPACTIVSSRPCWAAATRRQRHLAVRQFGGKGIADRGATAGGGQKPGDVEPDVLEIALLLGDRIRHSVHSGAEVRDVELDRASAGRGGKSEQRCKAEFDPHGSLPIRRWVPVAQGRRTPP